VLVVVLARHSSIEGRRAKKSLAWVMPFPNSLSFAIGAIVVTAGSKGNRKSPALYYVPIASGLIAGQSLIAAIIAIACTVVGLLGV